MFSRNTVTPVYIATITEKLNAREKSQRKTRLFSIPCTYQIKTRVQNRRFSERKKNLLLAERLTRARCIRYYVASRFVAYPPLCAYSVKVNGLVPPVIKRILYILGLRFWKLIRWRHSIIVIIKLIQCTRPTKLYRWLLPNTFFLYIRFFFPFTIGAEYEYRLLCASLRFLVNFFIEGDQLFSSRSSVGI